MKKLRLFLIPAAAVAMSSCTSETVDPAPVAEEPVGMAVEASIEGTRASGTAWENEDAIGICCTGYSSTPTGAPAWNNSNAMWKYMNCKYTYALNGNKFTANNIIWFEYPHTMKFSAYYPYAGTTSAYGSVNIDTQAKQSATLQKTIDVLYAEGTASKASPTANFTFSHKMAKVVLKFTLDKDNGFAANSSYLDGLYPVLSGIKHTATFAGNTGTISVTGNAVNDWQPVSVGKVSPVKGSDNLSVSYTMILLPQSISSFGISLKDANNQSFNLKNNLSANFEAGKITTINIKVTKQHLEVTSSEIKDWNSTTASGINADMQTN